LPMNTAKMSKFYSSRSTCEKLIKQSYSYSECSELSPSAVTQAHSCFHHWSITD